MFFVEGGYLHIEGNFHAYIKALLYVIEDNKITLTML